MSSFESFREPRAIEACCACTKCNPMNTHEHLIYDRVVRGVRPQLTVNYRGSRGGGGGAFIRYEAFITEGRLFQFN